MPSEILGRFKPDISFQSLPSCPLITLMPQNSRIPIKPFNILVKGSLELPREKEETKALIYPFVFLRTVFRFSSQ